MKSRILRGTMPALTAALLAFASSAHAIAIWPSMPGSWVGFWQSSSLPAVQLPAVQFGVTNQRYGLFAGTLLLPAVQLPAVQLPAVQFNLLGSVSTNSSVPSTLYVLGRSTDGTLGLLMYGKTVGFADGSVRIASVRYGIFDLLGNLTDQGYLVLLQRFGGLTWMQPGAVPDVSGSWRGTYDSSIGGSGSLMADLRAMQNADGGLTSAFGGSFEFDSSAGALIALLRPGLGTVGLPAVQMADGSLASPFLTVGQDEHGIIAVLIGLLLPAVQDPATGELVPAVRGNYMLFRSPQDVFNTLWTGRDTSFDHGTFGLLLPAV